MKQAYSRLLATALALASGRFGWADPPKPPSSSREPASSARPASSSSAKIVYASAFEYGAGEPWSKRQVTKCPSGKHTFLGPFAYECTTLSLDNLPEHARVRLSFDLMIILTWDGDGNLDHPGPTAPDLFDVTVDRGPRLVHASFVARPSSESATQSFPGRFPYDHLPPGTAAVESRSLGYFWPGGVGSGPDDYVYHIEQSFAHSGRSLKIAFSGINLEPVDNECWGLENVRVEVLPPHDTRPLDEAAFRRAWSDLGSSDPEKFVPAIHKLTELGEAAVAAIRQQLAPPADAPVPDPQRIAKLIAQLNADDYMDRQRAMAALREMGVAAGPALRSARENAQSLEALTRIDKLLSGLRRGDLIDEASRRLRRAVQVLELIGGQQARAVLSDIAGRAGTAAWEAEAAIQRLDGKAEIPTKLDLPPGLLK